MATLLDFRDLTSPLCFPEELGRMKTDKTTLLAHERDTDDPVTLGLSLVANGYESNARLTRNPDVVPAARTGLEGIASLEDVLKLLGVHGWILEHLSCGVKG